MLSPSSTQALARLRAYSPPPTNWYNCPVTRRAAVLILLFPDRYGELKVVLTMRASTLRSYAGQVALPGGKADSLSETPFDTARREAYEEIGLPTTNTKLPPGFKVEHLCELPANLAKTELGVRPCVAFLCPSSPPSSSASSGSGFSSAAPSSSPVEEKMIPRLDPKEVAAVFTAPFHNFLRKTWAAEAPGPLQKNGKPEKWYRGSWTDWHESRWRMHNFYIPKPSQSPSQMREKSPLPDSQAEGDAARYNLRTRKKVGKAEEPNPLDDLATFRVFGMTARILVDAARVAYGEEPEFEHNSHFGDEDMIGRLLKIGRLSEIRKKGEELTREVIREASKI
ncbi:uncharacterized protein BDR25DRAFT_290959 [Lindgomyces ingoldianus]|uniref:Uncharacterized protein n=1 Tax=Lindgomyces ingoldianus TaxID=673940 RepID=A0ACB6QMI2_9PLEO|nr:uncharacterized protein BDR25DRAFT_290959 [Lindgomyces ingoldianus]KAF2468229.1 hypothetical protein BDR25DRAFT_290959 [Lindgomyces ingoldianus]